jgi:hypothetical protein
VVETTPGHRLAAAQYDPPTSSERIAWYVTRALEWIGAASRDELVRVGDPFELPYYWPSESLESVAFHEGSDTFRGWNAIDARAGLVDFVTINDQVGRRTAALAFRTASGQEVVRPTWGTRIARLPVADTGVWLRINGVPYTGPWKAPDTFGELREIVERQGVRFDRLLEPALEKIRDGRAHVLLVGFPIPLMRGDAPSLMHWVGLKLDPLVIARARTPIKGFRTSSARRLLDRREGALANANRLTWLETSNWHPAQLGSRGHFEQGLKDRKVVVLGSGALGSAIAELLVRGGVRDICVVDGEVLEAGNLVRHTLAVGDVGLPKAFALCNRLNDISPNASATAVLGSFPALNATEQRLLRDAGLIIDTTGDDDVVRAIGSFDWEAGPHEFASMSFSYGAERLYSYVAPIGALDPDAFLAEAMPWVEQDKRLTEDMVWEGAGCRYPVFPARADDVMALAALAVRDLDERLLRPGGHGLRVFERAANGTLRRVDGEPAAVP